MHPADIIASLRKHGYTQSRLARETHSRFGRALSHSAVGNVIYGRSKSRQIAAKISRITRTPIDVLFPGVYDGRMPSQRNQRRNG